jgi:hypothetical protein
MTKLYIRHFRNLRYDFDNCETPFTAEFVIDNLGGVTMVSEQVGENTFQIGVSICNRDDNFSKVIGRIQALGRLTKDPITISREEMEEILEEDCAYGFYLTAEHILNQKGLTASKAFV